MTTRRAPTWKHVPPPLKEDALITRAKKLPMPGPGIKIDIAVPLYPTYLQLYHLVPMTLEEVSRFEQTHHVRKPDGVVWVKRVKVIDGKKDDQNG
jgi:hypothetical protein